MSPPPPTILASLVFVAEPSGCASCSAPPPHQKRRAKTKKTERKKNSRTRDASERKRKGRHTTDGRPLACWDVCRGSADTDGIPMVCRSTEIPQLRQAGGEARECMGHTRRRVCPAQTPALLLFFPPRIYLRLFLSSLLSTATHGHIQKTTGRRQPQRVLWAHAHAQGVDGTDKSRGSALRLFHL